MLLCELDRSFSLSAVSVPHLRNEGDSDSCLPRGLLGGSVRDCRKVLRKVGSQAAQGLCPFCPGAQPLPSASCTASRLLRLRRCPPFRTPGAFHRGCQPEGQQGARVSVLTSRPPRAPQGTASYSVDTFAPKPADLPPQGHRDSAQQTHPPGCLVSTVFFRTWSPESETDPFAVTQLSCW